MMSSPQRSGPCLKDERLCDQLAEWFKSPLGLALIDAERALVRQSSSDLFGVRQLEVGIRHDVSVSGLGNCAQRVLSVGAWSSDVGDGTLVCAPEELALPSDCIDLAVLHHTLDFASHPHQALREVSRVLRGGGHLVIVGFNPMSLWGWRRSLSKRHSGPWCGRFLPRKRVEDWLGVLDFVIEERQLGFYRPPIQNPAMLARFAGLDRFGIRRGVPGGAFYVMVAEKRVGARIRPRPVWARKNVIPLPVANPARAPHYPKEPSH